MRVSWPTLLQYYLQILIMQLILIFMLIFCPCPWFLAEFLLFHFLFAGNVMSVIDSHVYICWAIGCSLTNDWTSPHCHIFTSWCLSLFIWSLVGQEGPSKVWWCIITFIVIVSQLILRRSWWACQICHAGECSANWRVWWALEWFIHISFLLQYVAILCITIALQ